MVAHVFVEDVAAPAVALSEGDFHHLSRALRLRPGEAVSVSDGAGWSLPCRWTGARRLEPAAEPVYEERPQPAITVAFALTKGEHPDWAVQKLTEAGVDRVVIMTTARCVARWARAPEDAGRRLARLREIARQAAMQSRRVWLPSVEGPLTFADLVAGGPAGEAASGPAALAAGRAGVVGPAGVVGSPSGAGGVALAVPGGAPLSLATPTVLVGPEGGWSAEELDAVATHVGLGPHVLRAETAALAAGVLLAALRGGFVAGAETEAPRPRPISL